MKSAVTAEEGGTLSLNGNETGLRGFPQASEIVSILMESALYFDLPVRERLLMVKRFAASTGSCARPFK